MTNSTQLRLLSAVCPHGGSYPLAKRTRFGQIEGQVITITMNDDEFDADLETDLDEDFDEDDELDDDDLEDFSGDEEEEDEMM